jgi:hypothetical protein
VAAVAACVVDALGQARVRVELRIELERHVLAPLAAQLSADRSLAGLAG